MFVRAEEIKASVLAQPIEMVNMTLDGMADNYVMYEVWAGDPLQLVYLGVCRFVQLPQMPDAQSNSAFARMIGRNVLFSVRVVATGTKTDCMRYRQHVARHIPTPPICNLNGAHGRFTGILCEDDGKTYRSQAEAAMAYGISQGNLSSHLSGKPGNTRVGGRKFRRVALA